MAVLKMELIFNVTCGLTFLKGAFVHQNEFYQKNVKLQTTKERLRGERGMKFRIKNVAISFVPSKKGS